MMTTRQVVLMMYEYVYRHVPPNQPLTARDAEPPTSGETTSARCVIDHQSEVYYKHVANAQSNTYSIFGNFNIVISM